MKAFDPGVGHSEAISISSHHARLVRYGLDLTEVLESLPTTVDLIERQEARLYVQIDEEEQ